MADRPVSLTSFSLATFNVVTLGLVALTAAYAGGALSPGLSDLGTAPGIILFAYLWGLTLVATRWALDGDGFAALADGEFGRLVGRGALAGALVGAAFVDGLVLSSAIASLFRGLFQPVSVVLFLVVGGLVAGAVGGLVGLVFVLVDTACYRLSAQGLPREA